jgi:Amt family ammonium transporter
MNESAASSIDAGSTAWMLVSSAMVLLMVPGLALFYGGMVRRKNILSTMMHSFVAMAVIGVQWILIGYCLSFGTSQHGVIGFDPALIGLNGVPFTKTFADKHIPELVFIMFQGKFAIITPALISGALAERLRLRSYIVFIALWATIVYAPLAHWVWASDGWLFKLGVLDFAGGTVVHISAGVSALVLAVLLGPRRELRGRASAVLLPNNLPLTLTGAGLLWFGWFGFNAGSAVAVESPVAGAVAGLAFTTTQAAAAAAALSWMLVERWHSGKATTLGLASGIVAGLVAITPAAGHVTPLSALALGALSGAVCYGAVQLKHRVGVDDTLDAFAVHGVGGLLGAVLTGVFCVTPVAGLLASGDATQLGKQIVGVLAAVAWSAAGTFVLAKAVDVLWGLRVTDQQERDGLDISIHGERGYHLEQA